MVLISDGQVAGNNGALPDGNVNALLRDSIQLYAVATDLKLFEHATVMNAYARNTGGAVFEGSKEESMAASFGQLVDEVAESMYWGMFPMMNCPGTRPVVRKIEVKVRGPKLKLTHRLAYMQYP